MYSDMYIFTNFFFLAFPLLPPYLSGHLRHRTRVEWEWLIVHNMPMQYIQFIVSHPIQNGQNGLDGKKMTRSINQETTESELKDKMKYVSREFQKLWHKHGPHIIQCLYSFSCLVSRYIRGSRVLYFYLFCNLSILRPFYPTTIFENFCNHIRDSYSTTLLVFLLPFVHFTFSFRAGITFLLQWFMYKNKKTYRKRGLSCILTFGTA